MEKHILICGERGVGKSTLIRRLLAENCRPVGGFVTRRLTQADGDGMFPIYLHAAALPPEERPYDPEHLVGTCDSRRSVRYPEAFDRLGPPLLTSGGLLVMDELGFLENDAHRFQAAGAGGAGRPCAGAGRHQAQGNGLSPPGAPAPLRGGILHHTGKP